eukprot:CAMPEP_0173273208 /NCGR_PEP_ID=MMETSP1143-20121109/1779_1 /TAXON_ID=483371 /ORGANISM="non described non described, Strain CCMP2298" /LENGTH=128 /DNA_ID=CAMNT_0014209927 /DNA_START=397 /DNA_END=779 /DNA_ORIENTATION=-
MYAFENAASQSSITLVTGAESSSSSSTQCSPGMGVPLMSLAACHLSVNQSTVLGSESTDGGGEITPNVCFDWFAAAETEAHLIPGDAVQQEQRLQAKKQPHASLLLWGKLCATLRQRLETFRAAEMFT